MGWPEAAAKAADCFAGAAIIVSILLGILSSQVSMVVGFYYGSSSTNKRQSDTIDKLAETAKTVTQAAMPTPSRAANAA